MATFQFKGLDEYIKKLEELTTDTEEIMKRAVYAGADKIANSLRSGTFSVSVQDEPSKKGDKKTGITSEEKAILSSGIGIARIRKEGDEFNTRVGFSRDAAKIARRVEYGTSYMQSQPFIRMSVRRARAAAEAAMAKEFDEQTKKIMN